MTRRHRLEPDDQPLPEDEGGDPACWAHLVCPACGSLDVKARATAGATRTACSACGYEDSDPAGLL